MLARSWESQFCPSVCLSHTCFVMKTADIFIRYERVITLVFWYQQRMVGDVPLCLKFVLKVTHPRWKTPTSTDICLQRLNPREASEKYQLSNRKPTTPFSTSYIWNVYVTPNSPSGSKSEFVISVNKINVQSNKVCYKVSLCENFQWQSCRTIPISNGV